MADTGTKYQINNSGCRGAFVYNTDQYLFDSVEDAIKGAEWLHKNHSWRSFPYYIVNADSGEIIHTINED